MITPSVLSGILGTITEKIPLCGQFVTAGRCDWDCCKYTDSYILLLPGELESATALGFDVDQYDVLDRDFHGGVKVVPSSRGCCVDPTLGDRAYKSLDCRLFPFWFQMEQGELVLIQGLSCPMVLAGVSLEEHRQQVARVAELLAGDPDIVEFLRAARMVNYEVVPGEAGAPA